jgi:hypothetical protein
MQGMASSRPSWLACFPRDVAVISVLVHSDPPEDLGVSPPLIYASSAAVYGVCRRTSLGTPLNRTSIYQEDARTRASALLDTRVFEYPQVPRQLPEIRVEGGDIPTLEVLAIMPI